MSRSGYDDDCDGWALIRWRGAVAAGIRGKRGQKLLTDMLAALDAMPVKALIADELQEQGSFCALGALGHQRGLPMDTIDPYDAEQVAASFDVSEALAREIVFLNDEGPGAETPEQRWARMRRWVSQQIIPAEVA
jgi:hypothetical protein